MFGPQPELRAIFCETLDRNTPQEQAAYLDQVCAGRPELRGRVEALLQAHQQASSFLQEPTDPMDTRVEEPRREEPGTTLGPYKLLEMIGEGGFGLVFLAQQQQPVRRQVAVKILKPGMDSRQVVARFEAERHALALMDHANIAKVLDAGETSSGRPYFVMELCRGVPITDYCDQNALTPRERLALFVSVCQAVQHAHHKGLIHRDLKPSNVLVTMQDGVPVVKVIDFGIAKALGQPLTDNSLVTSVAQMIGTPLYMSPEQAEMGGLDIDTRSDIYSLGVLLYELLAGTTPVDKERLREAGYDEWRRIIREEEPAKPSTRLSTMGLGATTVSSRRKSDPKRLSRLLRGELDWIAMKALEKNRTRRYETASAFAADVQRYLQDQPVTACPPSIRYRCGKFARRHKAVLATAVAATLGLLLAVSASGWWLRDRSLRQAEASRRMTETEQTVNVAMVKAEQLRDQARQMPKASMAEAEAALLVWQQAEATLGAAEAALNTGAADERVRQRVLDEHQEIERGHKQAQRQAKLLHDIDDARMTQHDTWSDGRFDSAGAVRTYAAALTAYGFEVTRGGTDEVARRIRAEEPVIRDILIMALDEWCQNAVAAKDGLLATQLRQLADAADDDAWRRKYRAATAVKDVRTLKLLSREARQSDLQPGNIVLLARTLFYLNEREEAYALLRWGRDHYPSDFWVHFELGQHMCGRVYTSPLMDLEEAFSCCRAALALRPTAGPVYNYLGNALRAKNRLDEAINAYRQAIRFAPKEFFAYYNVVTVLFKANRSDEAVMAYRRAMEIEPNFAQGHYEVGNALSDQKLFVEAKAAYRRTITISPRYTMAHFQLGNLLLNENQLDEAIVAYRTTLVLNPIFASCHYNLALALLRRGRFAEAKTSTEQALKYLDPPYSSLRPKALIHLEYCERLLRVQARLPDFLAGTATYADNRERLDAIVLCQYQRRYATAFRLCSITLAKDSKSADDPHGVYRLRAAGVAILAAEGQGVDAATLVDAERTRCRKQALEWLRADLALWRTRLEANTPEDRPWVRRILQSCQRQADLNSVRQDEALKKLSAEEQQEWRKFWADVAELLAKVGDTK